MTEPAVLRQAQDEGGPNEAPKGRRDRISGGLLVAAAPMLAAGLLMPAISVSRLAFFEQTYSIWDAIVRYLDDGKLALFALVLVFSVLFPAAKIGVGLWVWATAAPQVAHTTLRLLATVSRWSMVDVFIIALMVLVVDGRMLDTADIHFGIVLFAAAAIASTLATHRLNRLAA